MRFSKLVLERYGRFEGCELEFRDGSPDLHIVYGANEAGKTTSLAAVSDLLFGFPERAGYDFLFDRQMLRVGAVLQDGGRTLACRRKRGRIATLLDSSDAAIDEGALRTMLAGQTRETFGFSFSLDQEALRSGGKAMVEAKNDLGRTLFAAGSGLTSVANELKALDAEADAIWGPTAKASRTYTQAQRQLAEAAKAVKDNALKPKAWTDAKAVRDETEGALRRARRERDEVDAELRAVERVRRVAPLARRREEALATLAAHSATIDLGRTREDAAEKLVEEADAAVRAADAAEQLRAELEERRRKVAGDPAALTEAEAIDQLVVDAGAVSKATRDLIGLTGEHAAASAMVDVLRQEAGANADAAPPRAVAARLRELARLYGGLLAEEGEIEKAHASVGERRARAEAALAKAPGANAADALMEAVEAAKKLGSDADERVDTAHDAAMSAARLVGTALAKLVPWRGDLQDLFGLPTIDFDEVERARDDLAELGAQVRREQDEARRATEQAEAAALEVEQIETGSAVSPEELASARAAREASWRPLRDHVLAGMPMSQPEVAVSSFERAVATADERADLRFALADASSRLSIRQQAKASYELEAKQAMARAGAGEKRGRELIAAWHARLTQAGLPALDPAPFLTWQKERARVEEAKREADWLATEEGRTRERRDEARRTLAAALSLADPGGRIAPVLATAERRCAELERALKARLIAQTELDGAADEATELDRRKQRLAPDLDAKAIAWREALVGSGLELDVATCGTVLGALDELREGMALEAGLRRRIEGIARDAREHTNGVAEVADRLGVEPGETSARLAALKSRLAAARSAQAVLTGMAKEDAAFRKRIDEARAELATAKTALSPLLAETGASTRVEFSAAIERSRALRVSKEDLLAVERKMVEEGDGLPLEELVDACASERAAEAAAATTTLTSRLAELNDAIDAAATAHGEARKSFQSLDTQETSAADAAAEAEQARAELESLSEHYILKRAQAVTLKWAIERYRERHQDPLLLRAGDLFAKLTTGSYSTLKVDTEGQSPRLLGLRADGRTMVEVGAMSEGTVDQLFLALRLAALERSVASGVALPFLADDLFVNFDDERAHAGFEVLAEIARSMQVLFFTHHPHLVALAKSVVGAQLHSECALR